ncbi:MAG TPA: tRNA(Ile)-lysidine synthetase, partial [Erysipelotrichaceae bacterium]|nr:tRNA(Ile)-lysidine synthetase [Erysipelotrichaceae bacterium]
QKEALLLKAKAYNLNKQHIQDQLKPLLEKYHAQNKINYHEVPEALYSDFLFALLAEKIPVEKLSGHLIHEIIHQMTSTKPNITLQLPLHQQFIKAYDNITVTTLPSSEGYAYT